MQCTSRPASTAQHIPALTAMRRPLRCPPCRRTRQTLRRSQTGASWAAERPSARRDSAAAAAQRHADARWFPLWRATPSYCWPYARCCLESCRCISQRPLPSPKPVLRLGARPRGMTGPRGTRLPRRACGSIGGDPPAASRSSADHLRRAAPGPRWGPGVACGDAEISNAE